MKHLSRKGEGIGGAVEPLLTVAQKNVCMSVFWHRAGHRAVVGTGRLEDIGCSA